MCARYYIYYIHTFTHNRLRGNSAKQKSFPERAIAHSHTCTVLFVLSQQAISRRLVSTSRPHNRKCLKSSPRSIVLRVHVKFGGPCAKCHIIISSLLLWPCKTSDYNVHNLLDR